MANDDFCQPSPPHPQPPHHESRRRLVAKRHLRSSSKLYQIYTSMTTHTTRKLAIATRSRSATYNDTILCIWRAVQSWRVHQTGQTEKLKKKRTKNKSESMISPVPWSWRQSRVKGVLRWEGFVEQVDFEPGVKEWRSYNSLFSRIRKCAECLAYQITYVLTNLLLLNVPIVHEWMCVK